MYDKISKILRSSPRVNLKNVTPNPYSEKRSPNKRGQHARNRNKHRPIMKYPLGYEKGKLPFHLRIPTYGYNKDANLKRDYQPLTLWTLQRMIDLGRIDPSEPIDITTLVNSRALKMDLNETLHGVFLVEQGADIFEAKVNIEVQIANEISISAVERVGGTITTGFYDPKSVSALCRPVEYFLQGNPIHKRLLPPRELVTYYCDPNMRGYLSDPAKLQEARIELANKFGYQLPDITKDENYKMLMMRKDPRQVFFGLSPGWIVNLADKVVIKPTGEFIDEYFSN
ncbi:large ribosomal subunit protein uL15m-like [Styela clava]|uniref:39S ribosomal protein L15, mitochondrial-like n=1 Tax=Styela clava TaxID=7725 RepID=UPI00193A9CCD|nr:39S ribosomal protein L15, mitochondrial-like [Styela clava]